MYTFIILMVLITLFLLLALSKKKRVKSLSLKLEEKKGISVTIKRWEGDRSVEYEMQEVRKKLVLKTLTTESSPSNLAITSSDICLTGSMATVVVLSVRRGSF